MFPTAPATLAIISAAPVCYSTQVFLVNLQGSSDLLKQTVLDVTVNQNNSDIVECRRPYKARCSIYYQKTDVKAQAEKHEFMNDYTKFRITWHWTKNIGIMACTLVQYMKLKKK